MAEEALNSRQAAFLYNPALLSRAALKELFVAHYAELKRILGHLGAAGSSPQHSLLIGDRGMGKTTLLLRAAYSLEEDPALQQKWLPVRFDEEQYNIGDLEDFWLNCLEKIGEDTGDVAPGEAIKDLLGKYQGRDLEQAALLRLREFSVQKGRQLLLLVDNFDLLLSRIEEKGARRLREVLQTETWLMLVGASARPILETFDYDSPFYDFFHVTLLAPLSSEETLDFLLRLGQRIHRGEETAALLEDRKDDIETLHTLVGGNLRTMMLLFSLLQESPAARLPFLLDRLLDQYTPVFRDMVETLPAQGQRVFDALARRWDPATAESVAEELRIPRGAASAQLHRLVDRDLVVKVALRQRSIGFQVRDRFFNLWYLKRSGRGQRRELGAFLDFLALFQRSLTLKAGSPGRSQPHLASDLTSGLQGAAVPSELQLERARRLVDLRVPDDPEMYLAGSAVALALDRPKQALEQLGKALGMSRHTGTKAPREDLLAMAILLGKDQPQEVLAELEAAGLDQEWRPLVHALALLGGDTDRLETLSPEMRTFTVKVVDAIRQSGSPALPVAE